MDSVSLKPQHNVTALPRPVFVRAAAAVLLATFLLRLAGGLATSVLNLFLKSQGQEGAEVGLVAAGYYATEMLLAPVFGAWSDRIGRKPLMVAAPILGAVALLLYPLSISFGIVALLLARMVEGLSAAGAVPSTLGYLSDLTDGSSQRARIMGLYEIATLFGLLVGTIILGPQVWKLLGVSAYPVLAVVYILGSLIFAFALPRIGTTENRRRGLKDYLRALGSKRLLRFMPAWVSATAVIGLWTVHVQNQLYASTNARHVPGQMLPASLHEKDLSLVLGSFAVAFIIGLYFWAARASKGRRTTPMMYAGGGLLWLSLCLFMLNHLDNPLAFGLPSQVWFVGLLVGAFFQAGFTPVALAYLADISEDFPEDRGVVVGLYSIFLAGGNLIGGAIGGLFVQRLAMDGVALLTLFFTLVAFFSILIIRRVSSD